jgi:hypothetical protein
MLGRAALFFAAFFLISVNASEAAPPGRPMSQDAACGLLRSRLSSMSHVVEGNRIGSNWYCEFGRFHDKRDLRWFLVAVRSHRQCVGTCNDLMGWYEVDRRTGAMDHVNVANREIDAPHTG